jgi:MFS transporter, YNFM family, putative membrane transport protein
LRLYARRLARTFCIDLKTHFIDLRIFLSISHNLWTLIAVRFLQGLFIPALTTCLAAFLSKALPIDRLNVVMGSYVSATVIGGVGGRLLGGWLHPPLHWRYAFLSAAAMVLVAAFNAFRQLPCAPAGDAQARTPQSHL